MLEALEASWPAVVLRTSFVLYPLVNTLHILAIGVLVTTASLMDLRVLGAASRIPADTVVGHLRPLAIGALVLAALSGFALFIVQPLEYWQNPAFLIKLALVVLAVANAAAFTSFRAHRRPDRTTTRIMAAASIGLWISVVVCGRFIGFLA